MAKNDITTSRIPDDAAERWAVVRAVIAGDQAMRASKCLPYLNKADLSAENRARNEAYVERAVFYGATGRTLDGLIGIAFKRDPSLQTPTYLDYLASDADGMRNSVFQQSQSVAAHVLSVGRHGLMVDYDARLSRPVIKSYNAETIINWRYDGGQLIMVVMLEQVEEIDGYGLNMATQYRELALENGRCVCRLWRLDENGDPYVLTGKDADGKEVPELLMRSQSKILDFIPFRFVGSRNNDASIDDSPLYSLAKLNQAHYRNSADYEDSVFYVGQAQPWIAGLTEEWRDHLEKQGSSYVGSRAPFLLPEGGAFGFAQPGANTLVKEAMDQKEKQMIALGARLLDDHAARMSATQSDNDRENSVSVLSMCIANVNEAYQTAIGWCAVMLDKSLTGEEAQASYKINQDYSTTVVDAQGLTALVAAWQTGLIAKPDLRAYLREAGVIAAERTDEAIDGDLELQGPALGAMGDVNPTVPAPVTAAPTAAPVAKADPVDLSPVMRAVAAVQAKIDALVRPAPVSAPVAPVAAPIAAPILDIAPLTAQISAIAAQVATIQNEPAEQTAQIVADALKPLQEQITALAARPVPVVDQAALKAAISQDMAALVTAMQRPQQVVMLDSSGSVTRQIQINRDEAGNITGASSTQA